MPAVALLAILLQTATSPSGDGVAPPPSTATRATAVRAKTPVVIDGRDDDEVWRVAPAITQFREFQPKEDGDPRRCEARLRDLQRWARGRRLGRRVGRRRAGRLTGLDRRVPDPAVATALRPAREQYLRFRHLARHPALHGAGQLARIPQFPGRGHVATR